MLCGVISSYLTGEHPGPANYVNLLSKTALMQRFNALDQWGRFDEAFANLRKWEAEGRLKHRQTVYEGIDSCVDALNGLFTGQISARRWSSSANPQVARALRVGGLRAVPRCVVLICFSRIDRGTEPSRRDRHPLAGRGIVPRLAL
ncbi:putative oxidoreductase zinc-binding protein [Mycobacterium ulcerans str. Harvey]|uniref:Oxidoreductase zinc-binding protein n=1 Tax=Mycobacterium ulcerans str. Harvey TaxID=1299332 RepID=A0ABP3A6C9_MYCUL|nr:putative oxidoreductase zinc-binding protein [Mycobacterium ulcerans str. Harvey]